MEAASRPPLEPLADLPVEEPFGVNGSASKAEGANSSSPAASRGPGGTSATAASTPNPTSAAPTDSDEDLLAHGVLLNLDPEAPLDPSNWVSSHPSAPVPQAGYDSGLVPTLLASQELLDPEV